MPNPRAKIESLDAENLRIAREMLARPDLYPPGSIGHIWATKMVAGQPEPKPKSRTWAHREDGA